MKKIRILHFITTLDIGGAERMLCKLVADQSRDLQFEHRVVKLTGSGELRQRFESLGVPVHDIHMNKKIGDLSRILKLRNIFSAFRPHIVQTWLYHADLIGTLAGKLYSDAKIIWNIRCAKIDFSNYDASTKMIFRLLTRLSSYPDGIIFNSYAGRSLHALAGYHVKKAVIIPNGFDMMEFNIDDTQRKVFRDQLNLDQETPIVGMVARYDPMKDYGTFFQAAEIAVKRIPGIKFVLIGRGMEYNNPKVMELIRSDQLKQSVCLLGERKRLHELYPGLDLLTLTSYGESFPNVLGEGMACGIPCVATNVGDVMAVVGRTGLVVPPQNPRALVDAWNKILSMPTAQRKQLGAVASRRIRTKYSIERIRAEYYQYYRSFFEQSV